MKHIFSRTTLILIAFLSIERFTFYSIKGYLPIYLSREFDFIFSEMKVLSGYLSYIPLLSYLIIGLTFDKLKKFSELRFYFLPIIVSLLLMFIKTPATFIIGYSILFFTGPFIKINVIIKIFDYLKSISKDDDRVFIFKFLVLNIFSALAPMFVGVIRIKMDLGLIFPILNLTVWSLFGLIYFLFPFNSAPTPSRIKGGHNIKTLVLGFGGLLIISFFSGNLWSSLFIENQDYMVDMKRSIIQMATFFLFGIMLLFIPHLRSNQKINISAIIILILGIMNLSFGIIKVENNQDLILDIVTGLRSIFDVLFYPALIFILLDTFNIKYRVALISLFYFIEFFVSDISGLLSLIKLDTFISVLMIILVIGFIIIRYRPKNPAVHNNGYSK